jgi:DNA invertase Pin-like site-specific DNA recombinase
MNEPTPALVRRLAVKVAAAFQDVENELAAREASASARPGRPRAQFAYGKVLILRGAGLSWRQIARELGASRTTVRRVYANLRRTSS